MEPKGIKPGEYTFQCFVTIGTIKDVREAMWKLTRAK
jgi:hypothetical protein